MRGEGLFLDIIFFEGRLYIATSNTSHPTDPPPPSADIYLDVKILDVEACAE
jgi:hypothetical protein